MFKRDRCRVKTCAVGASLTEQKWIDRQDVNSIVGRCLRGDDSGLLTCGLNYADVSSMPSDLQSLLNYRNTIAEAFDSLPLQARERWKTPPDFLAALDDENERPFFEKFGMLEKPVVEHSTKVETVNSSNSVTPSGDA